MFKRSICDPTNNKRKEDTEFRKEFERYKKANRYAKSVISSTITDGVYQKIMNKETAAETWEALKQQYKATAKDQLSKLCADFYD